MILCVLVDSILGLAPVKRQSTSKEKAQSQAAHKIKKKKKKKSNKKQSQEKIKVENNLGRKHYRRVSSIYEGLFEN